MDRLSRVGWNGTPHYRRAGGRLFGSRNSSKEIERVFVFNPDSRQGSGLGLQNRSESVFARISHQITLNGSGDIAV